VVCDKMNVTDQAFHSFGAIRRRIVPDPGFDFTLQNVKAGAAWRPVGGVTPTDGQYGGWLYLRTVDSFAEWKVVTTQDRTPVPWGCRTGPTNWARFYIKSGCIISLNWINRSNDAYNQESGLVNTLAGAVINPSAEWFFIPGDVPPAFDSYPFSVGPNVAPTIGLSDYSPLLSPVDLGYAPGLCRALYVEKVDNATSITIEVGREYSPYSSVTFTHRASFYADTWDSFRLINANREEVLFRWANTPISLEVRP
jgi:hypothetical protein